MRAGSRLGLTLGLSGLALVWPRAADATWSVVAVDPETQEVGVAVASCVEAPWGTTILPQVAGLAPGTGALAAQAQFSQPRRDQALALLTRGASPQELIDTMVAADGQSAVRQYGVVTLDLQTAAFTGAATQRWAGDQQGVGVAVQGNILYGPEVVADALAAFEAEGPRCPWTLADRLMIALEAGAAQGGDNRCSEEQTSLAAVLQVARPGDDPDAPGLDLRIPSQRPGGDNPVVLLRAEYDQWRARNPPDARGCGGEDDTGGTDSTAGGESGPAPTSGPPPPPAPEDTTGAADGSPPPGDDTSGSPPGEASEGDGGCGCRAEPTRGSTLRWLGVLLLGALRRRGAGRPPAAPLRTPRYP